MKGFEVFSPISLDDINRVAKFFTLDSILHGIIEHGIQTFFWPVGSHLEGRRM